MGHCNVHFLWFSRDTLHRFFQLLCPNVPEWARMGFRNWAEWAMCRWRLFLQKWGPLLPFGMLLCDTCLVFWCTSYVRVTMHLQGNGPWHAPPPSLVTRAAIQGRLGSPPCTSLLASRKAKAFAISQGQSRPCCADFHTCRKVC